MKLSTMYRQSLCRLSASLLSMGSLLKPRNGGADWIDIASRCVSRCRERARRPAAKRGGSKNCREGEMWTGLSTSSSASCGRGLTDRNDSMPIGAGGRCVGAGSGRGGGSWDDEDAVSEKSRNVDLTSSISISESESLLRYEHQ